MTPRLWALSLAPLLAASSASSAYAQAPGESAPVAPSPYYAPASSPYYAPAPAPAPVDPAAGAPSVMTRRWAIGLSLGSLGVTPEGASEDTETRFRIAELAVRYRATRRLELELAMSGGREVLEDDASGNLATGSVTLAMRYRFRPEQRWSWWVMGGLGGSVIAPHQSSEAEREGATRPLGMLGIGVERRFRRFALQAELRGIGLGPREDAMGVVDVPDRPTSDGPAPAPRLPAGAATTYAEDLGGGMITLGASYYF